MLRKVVKAGKEKLLFQLFFLKNDENKSVEVVEVEEIDFAEVKRHIDRGESVFITPKRGQESNLNVIGNEEAVGKVKSEWF